MNYDHIRNLVNTTNEEVIAASEIWSNIDDKLITVYKKYKLLVRLWEKDKDNGTLKNYLDTKYWDLMKEIRIARQLQRELGYAELSVAF